MISLSFDIEEFDLPLENNIDISEYEQNRISVEGTERIINLLDKYNIKATFFSTVIFATKNPLLIRKISDKGHEIASHGYYHSLFEVKHLSQSKQILENLSGKDVIGFRMPRMMSVSNLDLINAGYKYNSSLNPTIIPGRYNNLNKPRVPFLENSLLQIPAAVTNKLRIPLFWLGLHNYPLWLYKYLLFKTLKDGGILPIYFHPWEFYNLKEIKSKYKLPFLIVNNSGDVLLKRLEKVLLKAKKNGIEFCLMRDIHLNNLS